MKLKTNVGIGNKFAIEVYREGELLQKGEANNIVLDRCFDQILRLNDYFGRISFGRGEGVPSIERNTLFSQIDSKPAIIENEVYAYPVSETTKKIEIMPEEHVGERITEVGISGSSSYINTHAMVKDAEGNPLSIVKTELDLIVIYATVYFELQDVSENLLFYRPLDENGLLRKLLSNEYFTSSSFYVRTHKKFFKDDNYDVNLIEDSQSSHERDLLNKKLISKIRFDVNSSNEEIGSIELRRVVDLFLPEPNVYTGFLLKDQQGVQKDNKTVLPAHKRITDLVVYENNLITNDYIVNKERLAFYLQRLEGVGRNGRGVSISNDSKYIVAASSGLPYFDVHEFDEIEQKFIKTQELEGVGSDAYGVSISNNSKYIATASYNRPYFTIHKFDEIQQKFIKTQELEGVGSDGRGVSISSDSKYIVAASYSQPNFTIHKFDEIEQKFIKTQELEGIGRNGYRVSISSDSKYIVAVSYNQPYFTIHKFDEIQDVVVFNEPIGDKIITLDYRTLGIPKSNKYVLDVQFEIQFGRSQQGG